MPLTQPLAELRQDLEAKIRENQLPEALNSLLEQLPENSELHRIVSALIARLNAANKERYRNTISTEEYQRRVDQVSADFFDLLSGLKESDFLPAEASAEVVKSGKPAKVGSVLYRVPNLMPLQKPTRCTIRVAVDEDAILENILLDEHVHVKPSVEISDVMRAELVDPEGGVFQINPLNAPNQLVRNVGYTEWNFTVTPLREGVHQLLVKVSIMEIIPGYSEPIPRDVSVMETVTIVTDLSAVASAKAETSTKADESKAPISDFKPSGESFAFHSTPTAQGNFEINYSKSVDTGSDPKPAEAPEKGSGSRKLRALALFLAFIVLAPSATWALSPKLDRELFLATLETKITGSVAPLDNFIQENEKDPAALTYLDKAYFRKAEKTDSLSDLRIYQQKFGTDGQYRLAVLQKIETHETRAVASIQAQPNAVKIRQFTAQFPESERLPELKQAIEARAENRAENLIALENAYVASVQAQPTETKVAAYLRDFPKQERLNEVAEAAAARPEVLAKARPALEEAITRKVEAASTAEEVRKVLPALESAGSGATAAKVEQMVERKLPKVRTQVQQQVKQTKERIKQRERPQQESGGENSVGVTPSHPDTTPAQKSEQLPESSKLSGSSVPEERRNRRSGFEMVFVRGGTYTMGSPESEKDRNDDECQHQVTVGAFSIGKYEVTQADWFEIMGTKPSDFKNCDECPVEQVSWDDIQGFLKKLNAKYPGKKYRLPTEAEWEYAARGGNKSKGYQYAGSNDLKKVAWYEGNSDSKTHRVGELVANELGIFDMSGNVYEWCQDKYGPYAGCTGTAGAVRVIRGGGYFGLARHCRAACRYYGRPAFRDDSLGFRLALSLQ